MHPDALQELADLVELVDKGELPESAIPRLFYYGHKLLNTIHADKRTFRCLNCRRDFVYALDSLPKSCTQCNQKVYDISDDNSARWQCNFCEHIWVSEDGYVCPKCGIKVDNFGRKSK